MRATLITLFVNLILVASAWGQTWNCGSESNPSAVKATLNNGTLTISGKGAMKDYEMAPGWAPPPWFDSKDSIISLFIGDGVMYVGEWSFGGCSNLVFVTINDGVKKIGQEAFAGCSKLTSIAIPNSMTIIGSGAFSDCSNLTSMTIPNSVKTIGGSIFAACTSLTSIDVVADNNYYSSKDGVLFNKDKTTLIMYPPGRKGTYSIPNSVTKIERSAFDGCKVLTSIIIPNSVARIGEYAFNACGSLVNITIPNSVKFIEERAFAQHAYSRLSSVTSLNPSPPKIEYKMYHETFHNLPSNVCLYVPANSLEAYRSANGWKEFKCVKDITFAPEIE